MRISVPSSQSWEAKQKKEVKICLVLLISLLFVLVGSAGVSAAGIDSNTVLMLHGDGDASASSHKFTANGDPTYVSSMPANDTSAFGGSMYFDGTGDYLTVPNSADWDFGTGDFTIDFWMNLDTTPSSAYMFSTSDGNFYIAKGGSGAGQINVYSLILPGDNWLYINGSDVSLNAWHHIAIVRNSGDFYIFIDGVQDQYSTVSGNTNTGSASLEIGRRNNADFYMNGFLDEFRISKGIARWTANFTPDTSPYSSPDANTKLLLHLDGDSSDSEHNITFNGNASVGESSKWDGSFYFDGDGDYLSIPDSNDWDFGSGNFTMDFWINFNSVADTNTILSRWTAADNSWQLYWTTDNLLHFLHKTTTTDNPTFAWTPSTGTWYHVAVVRNGADLMAFIDGTQIGSTYNIGTAAIENSANWLGVSRQPGYDANYINGYLDELRISKGIARWTANFTPDTSPYSSAGFGNLTLSWVSPSASTYVAQNKFWNFTLNLSCSSAGDCGFVNVILDPWAINELMQGKNLQLDNDGNVIGVEEAETTSKETVGTKEIDAEKSWFEKIVEFIEGIFE